MIYVSVAWMSLTFRGVLRSYTYYYYNIIFSPLNSQETGLTFKVAMDSNRPLNESRMHNYYSRNAH